MNAMSDSRQFFSPSAPRFAGGEAGLGDSLFVDPLTLPNWDAQVAEYPEANVFHSAGWARVLHETYGHKPLYLGRFGADGGNHLLPVMEVTSPLTGRRGLTLPFTDFCQPLTNGTVPAARNWERVLALGRQRGWRYFECRGPNIAPAGARPALTFHAHELDLSPPEEELLGNLDASVRRAIRRALAARLTIEIKTDLASVRDYYALHCRTRRWHGVPPQPFRFFASIQRHLLVLGLGCVIQARLGERIVASAIFLHFGRKAKFKFGASDRDFQSLRANSLLMWEAIKWHAARGFTSLHFGRTSTANEGLRRFKMGFGPREERLDYFRYGFRRRDFVTTTDQAHSRLNSVFRHLPLRLLRALGSSIYPHLSCIPLVLGADFN
jgi:hypothetical protein